MTAPVIDIFDEALTDEQLLGRAYLDACEELARLTIVGRPMGEAIRLLDRWRGVFEHYENRQS